MKTRKQAVEGLNVSGKNMFNVIANDPTPNSSSLSTQGWRTLYGHEAMLGSHLAWLSSEFPKITGHKCESGILSKPGLVLRAALYTQECTNYRGFLSPKETTSY